MPQQQQMASLARGLGARVAAAHAEHADKPIDTGNRRLPAGIREGVARLATAYTKQYEDDKQGLRGQTFFRASAVVVSPVTHEGEKVAGLTTSVIVPLCDVPAKGQRKAVSLEDNWFEFQNIFKILGVMPPDEEGRDEGAGNRILAYYHAAMRALTDPVRLKTNPVYISFSTRGWTPPATAAQPKPTEMVFETWHGQAQWNGQIDPAAGVQESPAATQPDPTSAPPAMGPGGVPVSSTTAYPVRGRATDLADAVNSLVEVAMNDPEGATEEGADALYRLEEMAWKAGWSREQTAAAADWTVVGHMALNPPTVGGSEVPTTPTAASQQTAVLVGTQWNFCKRSRDGERLKNSKGEEFPPQKVEVVTVDPEGGTCTVKTVKDGKTVVDIRSKKPVEVKFEWLEELPAF